MAACTLISYGPINTEDSLQTYIFFQLPPIGFMTAVKALLRGSIIKGSHVCCISTWYAAWAHKPSDAKQISRHTTSGTNYKDSTCYDNRFLMIFTKCCLDPFVKLVATQLNGSMFELITCVLLSTTRDLGLEAELFLSVLATKLIFSNWYSLAKFSQEIQFAVYCLNQCLYQGYTKRCGVQGHS